MYQWFNIMASLSTYANSPKRMHVLSSSTPVFWTSCQLGNCRLEDCYSIAKWLEVIFNDQTWMACLKHLEAMSYLLIP